MNGEIKWVKIAVNVFDDEKIRYIETMPNGKEMVLIWFKIICLAGKCNSDGFLMMTEKIAYTEEMISSLFNLDIKVIQCTLSIFEDLKMIEVVDNKIYLTNWEKHQSVDKLENIREKTRKRVQEYRKKALCNAKTVTVTLQKRDSNVTETLLKRNSNATETDIETDIETDTRNKEKREEIKKKPLFTAPTLEEIEEYAKSRNSTLDCKNFFDYFTAGDWTDSRGEKVKNWKQKFITWESKENNNNRKAQKKEEPEERDPKIMYL